MLHLRCTCHVSGMYWETLLRRHHSVLLPGRLFLPAVLYSFSCWCCFLFLFQLLMCFLWSYFLLSLLFYFLCLLWSYGLTFVWCFVIAMYIFYCNIFIFAIISLLVVICATNFSIVSNLFICVGTMCSMFSNSTFCLSSKLSPSVAKSVSYPSSFYFCISNFFCLCLILMIGVCSIFILIGHSLVYHH